MIKICASIICIFMLSGCSVFSKPVTKVVTKAVDKYCQEPYSARLSYYEVINKQLAYDGNYIEVVCKGDPEHEHEDHQDSILQ